VQVVPGGDTPLAVAECSIHLVVEVSGISVDPAELPFGFGFERTLRDLVATKIARFGGALFG